MAMGEPNPQSESEPRPWEKSEQMDPETRRLWTEVANGIDNSQTVVWKNAVDSLESALRYFQTREEARQFTEKYMRPVIGILLEQQPAKIGQIERTCVEDSLDRAIVIISEDLLVQQTRKGECQVLDVLAAIFNRKKTYYKGSKVNWNANLSGLPEVRMQMIDKFRAEKGFTRLAHYLASRVNTPHFPSLDLLHQILSAIAEAVPNRTLGTDPGPNAKEMEEDAILVAQAVMRFISSASDDSLKKQPYEIINTVRYDLQRIFDRLVATQQKATYTFYEFWRALSLKLITSQSLPLKLFGWDQVTDLIDASAEHRPPPKSFEVSTAGCTFVNGLYTFSGATTANGYTQPGAEISYERRIMDTEADGAGKKLTLFRCTMRSQQKWWFLSEADEEQPGTDKDIDYYQHKSKQYEETEPPPGGWVTCRNAGVDPSPKLKGRGLMVPVGEEQNTLEHQLAMWAIEKDIIQLVLGDSMHREVVARSTPLIKFLATMCDRDNREDNQVSRSSQLDAPNVHCLQLTHLLLAWRTCTSKADAAVSEEVYQLLVSILPSLPNSLAIPLLEAMQISLRDKTDNLYEVAEFCSALASVTPVDVKAGNANANGPPVPSLSEEVRAEVLKLLWTVLTHPDASYLKSYANLKTYLTGELLVEPKDSVHREIFLESCTSALSKNAQQQVGGEPRDEALALRMVRLTRFVLEACPAEQAIQVVSKNKGALPTLLFCELTAYLTRRNSNHIPVSRKGANPSSSGITNENGYEHPFALRQRLQILRYTFGLSEEVKMGSTQLTHLWNLCANPSDREAFMVFVADASSSGQNSIAKAPNNPDQPALSKQQNYVHSNSEEESIQAAFPIDVRTLVFQELFCALSVDWDTLGERAYQSFQMMFKKLKQSPGAQIKSDGPALNALWRICLSAGSDIVASQAMKDLLSVYDSMSLSIRTTWSENRTPNNIEPMLTDAAADNFGNRMFEYLVEVKRGLENGNAASERSAERCLRILNAAAGQDVIGSRSITLATLSSMDVDGNLTKALKNLPHGMRSQSCYRRIGIMAKKAAPQNQSTTVAGPHQILKGREDLTSLNSATTGENGQASGRHSSTVRFSLDAHPLETLGSVKRKVASYCKCSVSSVKPISVSGRLAGTSTRSPGGDSSQMSLNIVPDDSLVDQLGIVHGCEMVFVIVDRQAHASVPVSVGTETTAKHNSTLEMSEIFGDGPKGSADRLFQTLLGVLEALPVPSNNNIDTHKLVWDLLLAMPTNAGISERAKATSESGKLLFTTPEDENAMVLESPVEQWSSLLNLDSFHHSVYVMQVIDAFLQPAPEVLCSLSVEQQKPLEKAMQSDAVSFRRGFIDSGGFDAVVRFFSISGGCRGEKQGKTRMGNAVALRILKCCMFGNNRLGLNLVESSSGLDDTGVRLLQSLSDAEGLLKSLTAMVVEDEGISSTAISDILKFLRLLLASSRTTESFVSLPDDMAKRFLMTLLLWEGGPEAARTSSAVSAASKIRKSTHDLILKFPLLASHSLPWLIGALDNAVEVTSDASGEYFAVLKKLVQPTAIEKSNKSQDKDATKHVAKASLSHLRDLGTAVCKKLASCPRPTSDCALNDFPTGVLCGCLKLLRALIENGGRGALGPGSLFLISELGVVQWSERTSSANKGVLGIITSSFGSKIAADDLTLIDLMGAVFDGFLSPGGSSSVVAICCDKESRQLGFDVVAAAARSCTGGDGYLMLASSMEKIITSSAPYLRHQWGSTGGVDDGHTRSTRNTSKYSGLRNQGCTCYMNSVLQQLFMMPELRKELCAAPIPACLRTSGGGVFVKGVELVGKKIALQWDSGVSYDASVEGFNELTGMHTIRYCPLHIATVGGTGHQQVQPEDIAELPPEMADEFFLSEGRPGKETGAYEVVKDGEAGEAGNKCGEFHHANAPKCDIEETEDEASSRHLLEECQRTFIHLDEGSRGRCFDPRALVEACNCLKLEFDVWQQNDASEFAMKFLDRLEISLKHWAPNNFKFLEQTFSLKQTKQKVCKECGLKTNREENLMSIDCQIRGKSDVHEALSTMCEVEFMEGDNKVFCDRCKKNTDTVLRTAISALPDMLVLSLKRFDLDYNTFETVKLNSRCAFGQTLNMKQYTLKGVEAIEQMGLDDKAGPSPMDTCDDGTKPDTSDLLSSIPDDEYEYKLAGVLVHAGVAQGGHYYSFIRDRSSGGETEADADKWYRFDDEDVTPFDPSSIEVECFGGKVKKETKWPNGQIHTVESEQFANALMLFYQKVKPINRTDKAEESKAKEDQTDQALTNKKVKKTTGFDVFEPDVRRSNATHRWQTFLFDAEFQSFLKGLLGLCLITGTENDRMDVSSKALPSALKDDKPWQSCVVRMLLSFVFDILLYSSDKGSLNYWVSKLSEVMESDSEIARSFTILLAKKSQEVGTNWLRTYLADCPEQDARVAAVRIFYAAIRSSVNVATEQRALRLWSQAWRKQISSHSFLGAMPTTLQGSWSSHEDLNALASGDGATAVGVIISYLAALLEVAPRTWRCNADLCLFIRELSSVSKEFGGDVLREALVESQIPARLIGVVLRERAPKALKSAFPGASVSIEAAETQIRPETNPSSHSMPLSGNNQVMNASDLNSRSGPTGSPVPSDYLTLFEALGCLLGVEGVKQADLVLQNFETPRARQNLILTQTAANSLSAVFHEACSTPLGMGQQDIEMYLQRCGLDSTAIPPQKVNDILSKYTTDVLEGNTYLNREGFLSYYRDNAQNDEARVHLDLHMSGFRPDLTRRPLDARILSSGGRDTHIDCVESVALDIAALVENSGRANLGRLSDLGLESFHLFHYAYSTSEIIAEYILAATAIEKDTSHLLVATLKSLYRAPAGWAGNEIFHAASMVFKLLAAIPDTRQQERISMIMQCTEKSVAHVDHGVGLLMATKAVYGRPAQQHYVNDFHFSFERYLEVIKELYKLKEVALWMNSHRPLWSWLERDLINLDEASPQHQIRGDLSARREGENPPAAADHLHSDSDMPCINDSEDDEDDDSRFDENDIDTMLFRDGKVYVKGAGLNVIDGVYESAGTFDRVGKYVKEGIWKDRKEMFSLFRCHVSDNTKRWYISIVPKNVQPGTNTDIDFYSAPVVEELSQNPPLKGWTKAGEGIDPPPTVEWTRGRQANQTDFADNGTQGWNINRDGVVDDNDGNPNDGDDGNGRIYI